MHVGGETQIPTLDATWKLLWMQIDIILNEGVLSIYGHSWVLRTVVRNGSAYWYGHNWEKGRRNSFFPTSLRRVEKWQKVNTLLCMIIKHEINFIVGSIYPSDFHRMISLTFTKLHNQLLVAHSTQFDRFESDTSIQMCNYSQKFQFTQ